jgi:uncharacterized repeat protein (TIGR02543 family)
VNYHANDGTGVMQPQTSAEPHSLTSNVFTRDGYTFMGWNTQPDGSGTTFVNGTSYAFAADMTLFAQWAAIPMSELPKTGAPSGPLLPITLSIALFATGLALIQLRTQQLKKIHER